MHTENSRATALALSSGLHEVPARRHGGCCILAMNRQKRRFSDVQSKVMLGLLAATCLAVAAPARADDSRDEGEHDNRRDRDSSKTHIAVDFDFNSAIDAPDTEAGGGGAVRLGQELDLFLVSLTPEFGGGYHVFGSGDDRSKLYSGFLGGRLAIGKIIEPSLFG